MNSELHRSLLLLVGVFLMGLPCFADDEIEQLFEGGADHAKIYDAIKRKYGDEIPEEVGLYLAEQIQSGDRHRSERAGRILRVLYFSEDERRSIPVPWSVRVKVAEIYNASSNGETDALLFLRDYGWPPGVSLDKVAKRFLAAPTHQVAGTTLVKAREPNLSDEVLYRLVDLVRKSDQGLNIQVRGLLASEPTLRERVVEHINNTWEKSTSLQSLNFLIWHFSIAKHEQKDPLSSEWLYPLITKVILEDETPESRSELKSIWLLTKPADDTKKASLRDQLKGLLRHEKASVQATAREWLFIIEQNPHEVAHKELKRSLKALGDHCGY